MKDVFGEYTIIRPAGKGSDSNLGNDGQCFITQIQIPGHRGPPIHFICSRPLASCSKVRA